MSSCVDSQCIGDSQMEVEIRNLKDHVTKTQSRLQSTENLKDLLIEKVKELKLKNNEKEKETGKVISVLQNQKEESLSLLEKQKVLIDELILKETPKVKKLRKQKTLLAESEEAALKQAEDLQAENANLRQVVAEKEQQENRFSEEIQALNNKIKEKEKAIKEIEEDRQEIESKNQMAIQEIDKFQDIMSKSELKMKKMEESLIKKFEDEKRELQEKINLMKEENEEVASVLSSANAQNESWKMKIEELECKISFYNSQAEDLQVENANLRQVVAEKEQQENRFSEEIQALNNEIKEKEKAIKEIEEDRQEIESKNQMAIQEIDKFQDIMGKSELKMKKMEESLIKKFEDEKRELQEKIDLMKEENDEVASVLSSANAQNESWKLKIEDLECKISYYEMTMKNKDLEVNELEIKNKEQHQEIMMLANSNAELLSASDSMKKIVANQEKEITKKQNEISHFDNVCEEKENTIKTLVDQIQSQSESLENLMKEISEIQRKKKRGGLFGCFKNRQQAN
eukprot:gene7109-7913_t